MASSPETAPATDSEKVENATSPASSAEPPPSDSSPSSDSSLSDSSPSSESSPSSDSSSSSASSPSSDSSSSSTDSSSSSGSSSESAEPPEPPPSSPSVGTPSPLLPKVTSDNTSPSDNSTPSSSSSSSSPSSSRGSSSSHSSAKSSDDSFTPPKHHYSSGDSPSPAKTSPSMSLPSSDDSPASSSSSHSDSNLPIVLGITFGIGVFLALMIVGMVLLCIKKKKKPNGNHYYDNPGPKGQGGFYNGGPLPTWQNGGDYNGGGIPSADMSEPYSGYHGTPLPAPSPNVAMGFSQSSFTYDELAAATNGFSRENMLGQGGFGYVYKGVLTNGKEIAVKQLKSGSGQGEREFRAEVDIISRVHHRHLVSLVGFCITGAQRLLVYEFVSNNTLEYHLHGKKTGPTMDWPTRLKIAIGSAKGLAYLHEDCHPRIIHRDIKSANILLDNNFEAMVADFGLAKLTSDTNTHVSTRVMGTFGYLAPEYAASGKLTEKSDVFSFGVMLLELITGRRPIDNRFSDMEDSLVDWARPILARALADGNFDELVDQRLEKNYDPSEMARMAACAAASVRHSGRRRPKMSQIVRALEGDVSLDDLNEGVKPGQSGMFSSGGSDCESGSYSSNMNRFRQLAFGSTEFSNEYSGRTSEYGQNPSDSSSSSEMNYAGGQRKRSVGGL